MRALRFRNFVFLLFFLSVGVCLLARRSQSAAEFIEKYISSNIRFFIAHLTSRLPFSLFEVFVLLSPLTIILLILKITNKKRFLAFLSAVSFFAVIYLYTVAIPKGGVLYFSEYDKNPTEAEIVAAAEKLISDVNQHSESLPMTLSDTSAKIRESYAKISHGFGVKYRKLPDTKTLIASGGASYLGILALYAFPTSEICINTEIPAYLIPHTVAHEYSHMLGVSREGEANFFGYVAAVKSDEPYIIYSASLSVLEYIFSDIAQIDIKMYTKLYNSLSERAKADIMSYKEYSRKYSSAPVFIFSDKIDSAHQNVVGGGKSYSYSAISRYVTAYLNFS